MKKMRVHELSKELGIQSKDLMMILNDMGAGVKNHMSTVGEEYLEKVYKSFGTTPKAKTQEKPQPTKETALKTSAQTPKIPTPTKAPEKPKTAQGDAPKSTTVKAGAPVPPAKSTSSTKAEKSGQQASQQQQGKQTPPRQGTTAANQGKPVAQGSTRPVAAAGPKPVNQAGTHSGQRPGKPVGNRAGVPGANRSGQELSGGQRPAGQKASNRPAPRPGQPQGQQRPGWRGQSGEKPGTHAQHRDGRRFEGSKAKKGQQGSQRADQAPVNRPITNVKSVQLPASITVKEFAQTIEVAATEVIKKLMLLGVMANINQEIDLDTAILVGQEFGVEVTAAPTEEEALQVEEIPDREEDLQPRWPVVTIMGHVDHGKTSLLDAIRETNVTAQEEGGITQRIGAYQVDIHDKKITFLDTPGHEAFTAMRARGAQVTDIAVLVVAADDGVMPQTVEAINHAKAADIPIIVAINKIDKPGANPERVKQELTEYVLVAEEWGGDTIMVPVSAKQRTGIENLLEMILLVAEMRELKANPNRAAKGTVIEAQLDKGRGPVATVLVQNGTLKLGDNIVIGSVFGKVRALINDKGKRVKKAGPSVPVEIIGLDELPEAGDVFYVIDEERAARQLAAKRQQYKRETELRKNQKVTLDDLFNRIKEGEMKELKIVLKAEGQGSVEALRQSLERLSNDEVRVMVIHAGVGAITESDAMLAAASNAVIIGFNVRPDPLAKRTLEREGLDLHLYRVIYDAIEDVKKAMEGMLAPEFKEVVLGRAEVRATFKVPKVGTIAGSYVTEGKITRNGDVRVLRDHVVVFEGKIESLKRFKDDVREVSSGFECGIGIERYNDIKEGDIIEVFTMEEVKRTNAG